MSELELGNSLLTFDKRTLEQIRNLKLRHLFAPLDDVLDLKAGFTLTQPSGYLDMLNLMQSALFIITDSGGIQQETTFLSVPCLTIRENTESPITVNEGTNVLVGQNSERLHAETNRIISSEAKRGIIPPLWDGKISKRILNIV